MQEPRRRYGQYCGLARALDLVAGRWTLLIIRELLTGPCRYNELLASLPGIGTNLLAARLKYLAEEGIIELGEPENGLKVKHYRLTADGEALRPAVLALARWGLARLDGPAAEDVVRARWAMLAVEAMIDQDLAGDLDEEYQFEIDEEVFHIKVRDGAVRVTSGPAQLPALTARTDSRTFVEIGSGRLSPLEAALTGRLAMDGGQDAVLRCSRLLGLAQATAARRR